MSLKELLEQADEEDLELLSQLVIESSYTHLTQFLHDSKDTLEEIVNSADLDSSFKDYIDRESADIAREVSPHIEYDNISGIPDTLTTDEIADRITDEIIGIEQRMTSVEEELRSHEWPDSSEAESLTSEIQSLLSEAESLVDRLKVISKVRSI